MKARLPVLASGLVLAFAVTGCKSTQEKNREHYDQMLPVAKRHVEMLSKIVATPVSAPACTGAPQPPVLVLKRGELENAIAGKMSDPTTKLETTNKHPCSRFDVQRDVGLFSQPLDEKRDFAAYQSAIANLKICFLAIGAIAVLRDGNFVAPTLDAAGTLTPGSAETDVMVYSQTGEPRCVQHVATTSKTTATPDKDTASSLLTDLRLQHEQDLRAFLGMKTN